MTTAKTQVINETGLHARPASMFVKLAKSFHSDIVVRNVTKDSPFVNAKTILRLLTSELCKGDELELKAEGDDETEAVRALIELVDGGFGEV